ncbi:MAG: hypothetical protein KTR16_07345 [Acidiferrobacterales bacterium]|nr:hypothetical protein [Acidiferrobacterales bacterium]
MKFLKHKLIAATLFTAFSAQAFAECDVPASPIIPDGNVASLDELVSAQKAMKMYQTSLGTYRDCLKEMEAGIDTEAEDAADKSKVLLTEYNASVDSEAAVAEEFNTAVRAFKTRQPASE